MCECHIEIIGLLWLSLDKCRNPLCLQITGNEIDWQGKGEKERGAAYVNCRVQKAEERKRRKHERPNGGELSSSYWIISDCQRLKGRSLHGTVEIPPNLLSVWGNQSFITFPISQISPSLCQHVYFSAIFKTEFVSECSVKFCGVWRFRFTSLLLLFFKLHCH